VDHKWDGLLDDAPEPRQQQTAVWTGSLVVVWGRSSPTNTGLNTGGRYDSAADAWTPTSLIGAPLGRTRLTGVWTGDAMVVWGGLFLGPNFNDVIVNSGGRDGPVTDVWTPTSTPTAPAPRYNHTAVCANGRMVVWGGLTAQSSAS